jgi:hypothetical protein
VKKLKELASQAMAYGGCLVGFLLLVVVFWWIAYGFAELIIMLRG